ncbi:hypothetical protein V8E55_009955 [Tylopilus felleus]
MAPLIPNGAYKIRNGEFHTFVAALRHGNPHGPIVAQTAHPSNKHDKFRIRNVGSGGNQVLVENLSRPGSYVSADQFEGASLIGSNDHLIWTIVNVGGGMHYLQSPDGRLVWELPRGVEYEHIMLVHHTGEEKTKWMFERLLD